MKDPYLFYRIQLKYLKDLRTRTAARDLPRLDRAVQTLERQLGLPHSQP